MSIIKCPVCGNAYDESHLNCPSCHSQRPTQVLGNQDKTVSIGFNPGMSASPSPMFQQPSGLTQSVGIPAGSNGGWSNFSHSGDVTIPISRGENNPTVTVASSTSNTVAYYPPEMGYSTDPVVGWLVCTNGKAKGKEYRLTAGHNSVGRTKENNVVLSNESTVSKTKHADITYEPRQNVFYALPGDSKSLFYVNDEAVLQIKVLKKNDRITVGNVELMLIPCCDEGFTWEAKSAEENN